MEDNQKNQALKQKIEELEEQAAGEQQEAATSLEKLELQHEAKPLKDRQLNDQELHILRANYSYLDKKYISLLKKHKLLEAAFKDVRSVAFDEYISVEADKIAQPRIKAIEEETESRMEALQSKVKNLRALVNSLTADAKTSSAKIQELETVKDTLYKALNKSTQSLIVKAKRLSEIQTQYNAEKKRLEDELCAFKKANEMLNEKFQKEEEEIKRKEEEEIKRKEEEEIKGKEEEEIKGKEEVEIVGSSVQPRSNTPEGGTSSAVFTPITCTESICK
eukprot:CAMPEP_0175048354 /NCGR_PEP_ID=MMETSP0052_2-20121109/6157_1 /TAXON_ID=51329 ORGANISM="Polytomella parva, Strain SAG 63-3" /NCGR_SAMPLE_ID=MMETSP0052_2 /ASSEMBLY_ACC=CAM_ASM_000194 /LENGTH=276 /DNA_ID=CAMNT_0016312437 /DNA_START=149 /DNA_END=976 /DNA_ORIENTATION=+